MEWLILNVIPAPKIEPFHLAPDTGAGYIQQLFSSNCLVTFKSYLINDTLVKSNVIEKIAITLFFAILSITLTVTLLPA